MLINRYNYPHLTKRQLIAKQKREDKAEIKRAKMRELPMMNCENCDTRFRPVRQWQKFCTNGCRRMKWSELNE